VLGFFVLNQVMGKGGDWLELGDDEDMKLPRPLVETMLPPSFDEAKKMGLDKWYLTV